LVPSVDVAAELLESETAAKTPFPNAIEFHWAELGNVLADQLQPHATVFEVAAPFESAPVDIGSLSP